MQTHGSRSHRSSAITSPQLVQRTRIAWTPGRYSATNATFRAIVKHAYGLVSDAQLTGGPDWINSARFNIEATAPGSTTGDMRPMLKRLLADRCGLKLTQQTRTLPIYRLVRTRNDDKVPPGLTLATCPDDAPEPSTCGLVSVGPSQVFAYGLSMEGLAKALSRSSTYTNVDRIVVDETGIKGTYRFLLRFAATGESYGLRSDPDPNLPAFSTALQEQLGLRLQPANGPVDVWVIASVSWPESD